MNSKDKNTNLLFWIPMQYNFTIRLKNNLQKIISWLFINLFPTSYYALVDFENITTKTIIILITFTTSFFYLYEFGYIQNDLISTKKEKNPTERLSPSQKKYASENYNFIKYWRILIFVISALIIFFLSPTKNTIIAISISFICIILFQIYNNWRSLYNAFLYFWLVACRFLPFIFIFNNNSKQIILYSILILLIYPLEIGIERFSMPKYRYPIISQIIPSEKSKTIFRFIYYLVITTILSLIIGFNYIIFPFFLFLIYRFLLFIK